MPFPVLCNTDPHPLYLAMAEGQIDVSLWQGSETAPALLAAAQGLWLLGHPIIDGAVMDTMPNLRVIRPGLGLAPKYFDIFLGKVVSKDIKRGTALSWDLIG